MKKNTTTNNTITTTTISSSTPPAQSQCLLLRCAELIHRADFIAARHAISILTTTSSPTGDAADRLTHHFTRALSLRLRFLPPSPHDPSHSSLSFNQLTPFLRFSHLTANQAILEAANNRPSLHILDFDTGHGLQWPLLLQAIADRSHFPNPPSIQITATGTDLSLLFQTGRRLQSFADSLGLCFHFHPICISQTTSFSFPTNRGEILAVNCALFLHKLIKDDGFHELKQFLQAVKGMNPAVVTVAEKEAKHSSPLFLQRFAEALGYYSAVFESLEATLPPSSRERMVVERMWIGREIEDIVAGEGEGRRERHERFERWEGLMKDAGFVVKPLSGFALAQARLLLRLHYPSEGYRVEMMKGSLFLGWKGKPLYAVSAWS
ncbi:LOW QUALITY PROTEIN: scarecrow-like protein 18 [Phalaenopsis equestris]|uniref:LOW QUALITY PROTEIN: scarecrow-like protein 18 n=1 Tax=Phalaenopsis equestris TaxID=78828 RepID=UPI0009E3498C|nr:LOW QUALITY PROTEIN: scarecrow-like protein 18 [Phalaenopsis equestris]